MKYDTIIIGAGVIGTSTAYYLQKQNPEMKILLLDKNKKIANGNTSRSAALYRNLFSSNISRILATSSITYYETIAERIGLKNLGYLWLFSKESWKKSQKGLEKLDYELNKIKVQSNNSSELANLKIARKSTEDFPVIHKALLGKRCGSLSAVNLARYYANQFVKLGGSIQLETEIAKINLSNKKDCYPSWKNVRIASISDAKKSEYLADQFIFTTGAWTNNLLSKIGIASQVYPKRRQMFVLKLKDVTQFVKDSNQKIPIIILPAGGVYIKPVIQSKLLMVGCAVELGEPSQMGDFPPDANEVFFNCVIRPVLDHYFPNLVDYDVFSKWAGYYAYYWPDKNPVVEKISNIQWVSGTSGSGIMKADAIGRIAAAKNQGKKTIELFDKTIFNVNDLSLKQRKVDAEELII